MDTWPYKQQSFLFAALVECRNANDDSLKALVRLGMAMCHTLSTLANGELVGTQVDRASFMSTGTTFEKKGQTMRVSIDGRHYAVVKRFEFDCVLASQSVIVEDSYGERHAFVKGSPEAIAALCKQSSVPSTFHDAMVNASKSGMYQLAIAFKSVDSGVDISQVTRKETESELFFGALINFKNPLRDETTAVIRELACAKIPTAMITGDSVLTGVYVARESGMIDSEAEVIVVRTGPENEVEWVNTASNEVSRGLEPLLATMAVGNRALAVSGDVWVTLKASQDPALALDLAKHIRVFGRCSPTDKVSVVSSFVESGLIVLMCGDGQNDCGALRSANVGVALSTAEASLVAPFSSLDKSLDSVTAVLREGRCALASSLAAYSYCIIWGQMESVLQSLTVYFAITFAEWNWIFLDGMWAITMAFGLPLAKAANILTPPRPVSSLLGAHTVVSICGMIAINFLFLVTALMTLWKQDWFQCRKWDIQNPSEVRLIGDNYESSVLFVVGGFQYMSSAIALNFGYTFRQSWWKNYIFIVFSATWCICIIVMAVYPSKFSCIFRVNCDNQVRMFGKSLGGVLQCSPSPIIHATTEYCPRSNSS
jgi:magnesium-transporting ATPase (P-type)